MARTRRAAKRALSDPDPDQPLESKLSKKKKTELKTSKYFNQDNASCSDQMKDSGVDLDQDRMTNSDDSKDSVVVQKHKVALKIKDESDSDESSSDEFMKAPFSLDDLGQFETLKKEVADSSKDVKECQPGVSRLSDDSDDENGIKEEAYYDFSQIIQSQELITNTKKEQEERAKEDSVKKKSKPLSRRGKKPKVETKFDIKSIGEELGVSELLAMAEGNGTTGAAGSDESEEEDETEEVKEESYSVPKEGVQVIVALPNMSEKKKAKIVDMEAAVKRRLNLIRRENQVFMHKVHTLCWLAHGIYLNRVINMDVLMGLVLSMIPSKHCYPKKHADLSYLENLVEWFVGKFTVDKGHKLALNSSNLLLIKVLETEINSKVVFSQRDLVLIFVSLVRSLGIDARLIISLRPVPLRPPAAELCVVSNKLKDELDKSDGSKAKKSVSSSNEKETDKTPTKASKVESIKGKGRSSMKGSKVEKPQNKSNEKESAQKTNKNVKKKPVNNGNKTLDVIRSPYFSSSDEIPLKELARRRCSSRGTKQNEEITSQTLGKPTNTSKIEQSSKHKVSVKTAKSNKSDKIASPYFTSGSETRGKIAQSRTRRPVPASYRERENSSSDEEVDIPKKAPRKAKSEVGKSVEKTHKQSTSPKAKLKCGNDSDFEPPKPSSSRKKSIDRRVLSSDDDNSANNMKIGNDFWAEVFLESEEKWISVDLNKGKVHRIKELNSGATQPVRYVIAYNNDATLKDVTRRYAPHWLTVTQRLRTDGGWWQRAIVPFAPRNTAREREENEDLDRQLQDKPMPTSIAEYKNHPLYFLKRHLLKFEAIYPPDAPTFGFVKGEPVYSRGCVVDLHTRETWIKEAKVVRPGETPYKIVKARPKWDKLTQKVINDLPLPLFGHWQVDDYVPPPAEDGKVPRNEYGNVELYKPCMLPPGTVHLQVPQLARVARKLGIDCAPAVVGWEFSGGSSHPTMDGYVVCEEFKDVLLDAWDKEMDESAKRAKEKDEQRVYGNWKKLIRGLLIRERLKIRYDFGAPTPEKKKKKPASKAGTSKS